MIGDDELRDLESTLLPALERHHLRLLAHALRTLQAVAVAGEGGLPSRARLAAWAAAQPAIADDPGFRDAFVEQLLGAGLQLEQIALWRHGSAEGAAPLSLELADLVAWARQQADSRLSLAEPGATPPPA